MNWRQQLDEILPDDDGSALRAYLADEPRVRRDAGRRIVGAARRARASEIDLHIALRALLAPTLS